MIQKVDVPAVVPRHAVPAATPIIPTHILDNARQLVSSPSALDHVLTTGRYQSPLRYPGAKSSLAPVIARILDAAKGSRAVPEINLLVEPFAGGASPAVRSVTTASIES